MAEDERDIALVGGAVGELLGEGCFGLVGLCYDEYAAGVAVESVYEARA